MYFFALSQVAQKIKKRNRMKGLPGNPFMMYRNFHFKQLTWKRKVAEVAEPGLKRRHGVEGRSHEQGLCAALAELRSTWLARPAVQHKWALKYASLKATLRQHGQAAVAPDGNLEQASAAVATLWGAGDSTGPLSMNKLGAGFQGSNKLASSRTSDSNC